jgi:hypothetical protein
MGFIRDLTGKTAVRAATQAGELQRETAFGAAEDVGAAGAQAGELLQPFQDIGQRGVDLAGFLGDPNQQFQFLQQNPLFQRALESANVRTERRAATRGRLSAGDTLEELTANTFQQARPFIQDQRSDILNLLNLGRGVASERGGIIQGTAADVANLQTGGAAAQAAGIVGAANARGQRAGNILSLLPSRSDAQDAFKFLSGGIG